MGATFSKIGYDLPSVPKIMNFSEKLDSDLLSTKKNQLQFKLKNEEITKSQFNDLVVDLESRPLYGTTSVVPDNIENLMEYPAQLPNNVIKSIISFKPVLVDKDEIKKGKKIVRIVGINKLAIPEDIYNKSFSPRLLNWVEPYEIKGINKTLFYTEVNSGLKVGDKVFIINGNYDNDILIKTNKYKKGRDGYKILYIDNCKIVLDINYTGESVYNEDVVDNFIKVHYVRDLTEFKKINREITTRGGVVGNKFNYHQNNIAFFDRLYSPISDGWGNCSGVNDVGFYVRNSSIDPPEWVNITNDFIFGSFSYALSPTYSNNNKIKIFNGTFNYDGRTYQEGFIYKSEIVATQSIWIADVTYFQPFITKSNFRNGNFKGKWNSGLFGEQSSIATWDGIDSTWESGTLLNSTWVSGIFNSKYTLKESFFADIDSNGVAYQKGNLYNNNGRGYNFIIDSQLRNITINNGTVENSIFGRRSFTFSTVENHLVSRSTTFNLIVNKGYFEFCNFYNSLLSNVEVKSSKTSNTRIVNSKVINSKITESIIKDSTFISDDIIEITDYDEWSATEFKPSYGVSNKIYKFYISQKNYERLKSKDFFYIRGLNIKDNNKEAINFFDKKFTLSSWTEHIDDYELSSNSFIKRPVEYVAYLSTPLDNQYKTTSVGNESVDDYQTVAVGLNEKSNYSVDIVVKTFDVSGNPLPNMDFNRDTTPSSPSSPTMSNYLGDIIDISNAYIVDSDFDSGIIETSNWINGYNINWNNDLNITKNTVEGGFYNISVYSTSSSIIDVKTTYDRNYPNSDNALSVNNVVFLNSVYQETKNYVTGLEIVNSGSNYITESNISCFGLTGNGLSVNINDVYIGGSVSNISILSGGYDYQVGNLVTIGGGDSNAVLRVVSVTSSLNLLPTDFKIISNDGNGNLKLQEIKKSGTSSVFERLQLYGDFYTPDAENRYGYLYKSKIHRTKVKSGIFKRSLFVNSFIENDDYDPSDKDYVNLQKIRNLVISDSLFRNNVNILSNATYIYCSFVNGSTTWNNGIIQKSIWNGLTFSNGIIKESRWVNGVFNSGEFYNCRSFNANPSEYENKYYVENTLSYYKNGLTTATISNDRYSWQNGIFKLSNKNKISEFYKSDWENGTFENGKFYYSKWYDGILLNGVFGDKKIDSSDTYFYNGTVSNVIVENASFFASDTSYEQTTQNNIHWLNGVFNDGVFGSNYQQTTASNTATWHQGQFNGGQFISLGKWKNGSFNGGKFVSGYGWTLSTSSDINNYSWENGVFNGGEFGNANLGTNSTWWYGQFKDGIFKGRVWNNGIFEKGEFKGGATISSVGGYSSENSNTFVDSFRSEFYGLWRDGFFTEQKDKVVKNEKIWSSVSRSSDLLSIKTYNPSKISNTVWLNGTFSNQSGEMHNVVWMNGTFDKGKFKNGSFNPYVRRNIDDKNVWVYDNETNVIFNGGFTESLDINGTLGNSVNVTGWAPSSYIISGIGLATFSLSSNQAVYTSETGGVTLSFTNKKSTISAGRYEVSIDVVTYSTTLENNLSIFLNVGSQQIKLIDPVTDKNIGQNKFELTLSGGELSLRVGAQLNKSTLVLDNLSVKKDPMPSFNFNDSCIWSDGSFEDGDFHISKWENGNFLIGTAYGMIWKSGISNYMNAMNIFWEDGTWRNGNWYGSYFEFNGTVTDDFSKQILFRGMSWSGTSSCHIWNIFEYTSESNLSSTFIVSNPNRDVNVGGTILPSADSPDDVLLTNYD